MDFFRPKRLVTINDQIWQIPEFFFVKIIMVTFSYNPSPLKVNIWGHFDPTPINRVDNAISNTLLTSRPDY